MYQKYIKRFLDLILSLVAIIILLPVLIIVSILVIINMGSPIIHQTKRVGKDEKIFTLYKFRSMMNIHDSDGKLLSDEDRITKFGKLLRSTSLDELPELFNILKGDMSIVGPRPLPEIYLPYYNDLEKQRHDIRPGLSGLAQVNGRNAISWEEKFEYDIKYLKKITFKGDVIIILKTLIRVFKRSDIGEFGVDNIINFNEHRIKQMEKNRN